MGSAYPFCAANAANKKAAGEYPAAKKIKS